MLRKSLALTAVLGLYALGCSAGGGAANGSNVANTGATGAGAGAGLNTGATGDVGNNGSGGSGSGIIVPAGGGDSSGGGTDGNAPQQCDGKFKGYLRDFTIANAAGMVENPSASPPVAETVLGTPFAVSPDFEVVTHNPAKMYASDPGMVQLMLGPDQKPVYAGPAGGTITTTGPANFATWFNDTPGVNVGSELDLQFDKDPAKPSDPNAYTFASGPMGPSCLGPSKAYCYGFYPIDGPASTAAPITQLGNEGNNHNYHMTFELHLKFKYHAGQVFTFKGDDDVWAFINSKLAVDLGGVHLNATAQVNLDTLGLTEGSVYPLDFFWCERHITASNFAIDTSLEIVDCGSVVVK
ncbi:MAG TPA: fibro-slime domain-containing protein [Polyangiaceae bacterium]|jgi:fibro-slime domain-containing protein|nr:fibro-slime domain-containing protein [Polyangiaceae bacterium]